MRHNLQCLKELILNARDEVIEHIIREDTEGRAGSFVDVTVTGLAHDGTGVQALTAFRRWARHSNEPTGYR